MLGLDPGHASRAIGGDSVRFDKKTATDDTNCFQTYQVGCSVTCNNSEGFTCPYLWTCDTCYQTCTGATVYCELDPQE